MAPVSETESGSMRYGLQRDGLGDEEHGDVMSRAETVDVIFWVHADIAVPTPFWRVRFDFGPVAWESQ